MGRVQRARQGAQKAGDMQSPNPPPQHAIGQPGRAEFIILAAVLMSIVALSVDLMLPAFQEMSDHFQLEEANERQAIITIIFAGLLFGQLFFGPLSDYIGRKPAILAGLALHIIGSLLCILAPDFTTLLIGRFLQGIGGAAARIVIVAMVRDRFVGQQMAQIMSVVLTVFILVPVFAPAVGQVLLLIGPWEMLFGFLILNALISATWLTIRQPETHTQRAPFHAGKLVGAARTVITTPTTMLYALAAGCAFGTLLGYIVSAQQILQDLYQTGDAFAFYFGLTAGMVAFSTLANAWLLNRYSMEAITGTAIAIKLVWALGFIIYLSVAQTTPPLWLWMIFISVALFLVGMTFGNYNAIALRPLGHIAGIASSITASVQTLVSVAVAALTGAAFQMNVMPVVLCAVVMGVVASLIMILARRLDLAQTLPSS